MTKRPLLRYTATRVESSKAGVYTLSGRLTGDRESYELLEAIGAAVEDGVRHVVLDLEALEFSNSSGLGIIASIYNLVHPHAGRLVVVGAGDMIRKSMEIIRLWELVGHARSVEDALLQLPEV
ncbi:STAS domain-containing protein [bacterium]|nr:STAS domain-containing protein [bacterium]